MYIRDYQIGNKLYEDVIGATHLANTTDLERAVFFKILHSSYVNSAEFVNAFHACAEKLCSLENSDNIQALEHGHESGIHYIIFEYFKFLPLEQFLQSRNLLHIVDAANLIEKITKLLQQYHHKGWVHGALTPQSIFVDERLNHVSISDFGFEPFVRALIQRNEPKLEATLPYYSPEFIEGRTSDVRSDVYSVGVLFYRIITGSLPWPELTYHDYLERSPRIAAIPPSLQRLEIPEIVDETLLGMLEVDPTKRCQSLTRFIEGFSRVKAAILAGITPITPPQIPTERPFSFQEPPQRMANPPAPQVESKERGLPEPFEKGNGVDAKTDNGGSASSIRPPFEFEDDFVSTSVVPAPPKAPVLIDSLPAVMKSQALAPQASTGTHELVTRSIAPSPAQMNQPTTVVVNKSETPPKPAASNNNQKNGNPALIPNNQRVAAGIKKNGTATTAIKKPIPQPVLNDDGDLTATQTEEFATTQIINLNRWAQGSAPALLVKFFLIPMTLLLCFYITISFLDFEWARNLPNFKNSILFNKIEGVFDSDKSSELKSGMNQALGTSKAADSTGNLEAGVARNQESKIDHTDSESNRSGSGDSGLKSDIDIMLDGSKGDLPTALSQQESASTNLVTLRIFVHSGQQPLPADVFVNGKRLGRTNNLGQITISNLVSGYPYAIRVVNNGYSEWNKEISFQKNGPANLDVDLNLAGSRLLSQVARETQRGSVTVLLSNALSLNNAFVYVNGQMWDGREKMAPTKLSLAAGRHVIEIRKEGFRCEPATQAVELAAGENKTISFRLIPN